MPSLQKRFPLYGRALWLYPKAYRRRYANQMLQTMADLLDAEGISQGARLAIWLRALGDLAKSIPTEQLRAVNPKTYIRKSFTASVVLIAPILLTVLYSLINSNHVASQSWFSRFWFGQLGLIAWGLVLPCIATIVAMTALFVWRLDGHKRGRRSLSKLRLVVLVLISIAGASFLSFVGINWTISSRHNRQAIEASRQYQLAHPTLACQLLPEKSAKAILGKDAYLNNTNDPTKGASGIVLDDANTQVTNCSYHHADDSKFGLLVGARTAKNPAAVATLHAAFLANNAYGEQPISLQGYNGFYASWGAGDANYNATFFLRLWVNDRWLEVTAPSFESASQAMSVMIQNLESNLQSAAQSKADDLQGTLDNLSAADRTAITEAVQSKEATIPAGTNYDVSLHDLTGDQVHGTFHYATGTHGTFTAERRQGQWVVSTYKRL